MSPSRSAVIAAALWLVASGCGGSGGTDNSGAVQVSTFILSPATVTCGLTLTVPLSENAQPDTVAVRAELVNTTRTSITLDSAGVFGIVLSSSPDTADAGRMELTFSNLPHSPNPATVRAVDGDVNVLISLPMRPLCNLKPPNFSGTQNIQVTARLITNAGLYLTVPATLRVVWISL